MAKKSTPTSHRWNLSHGQRLQHYKGGLYTVVGPCTIESTLEPGVLYQSFDPLARKDVWMRPASDFWSQIKPGVPRFSLVRQPTSSALWDSPLPGVLGVPLFKRVLEAYAAPERFYHGHEHIYDLFEKARGQGLNLSTEQALAVLLHDVVYVPGAPTGVNESQSVDYMRAIQASASASAHHVPDWDLVAKIILDTASHVPTCPQSELVLMLVWRGKIRANSRVPKHVFMVQHPVIIQVDDEFTSTFHPYLSPVLGLKQGAPQAICGICRAWSLCVQ